MSCTKRIPLVDVASNAVTIGTKRRHVTFYSRAVSSTGWTEARIHDRGLYASICVWGYHVALTWLVDSAKPRALWHHYFGAWARHGASPRSRSRVPLRSRLLAAAWRWMLRQPGVAEVIANEVEGSGAFCRVMRRATEDALTTASITADQIEHFDEAVSGVVGGIDASDIRGLDGYLNDALRDEDILDGVAEHVVEHMARRLGR